MKKSEKKLFVANLPWALRGKDLKEIFEEYGNVVYAKVILDQETRKSKGFGFVEFEDAEAAKTELEAAGATVEVK